MLTLSELYSARFNQNYKLTHLLIQIRRWVLKKRNSQVFSSFLFIVSFLKKKSMFAELNSDINSHKSSLLHLTGQPYCKKSRSAKSQRWNYKLISQEQSHWPIQTMLNAQLHNIALCGTAKNKIDKKYISPPSFQKDKGKQPFYWSIILNCFGQN